MVGTLMCRISGSEVQAQWAETAMKGNKMNKLGIAASLGAALALAGCASDGSGSPNLIQRADVLSKNPNSITIEHSDWGKKIAFRLADEHCALTGKVATYQGASKQYGPDVISTWRCE